jgi:hypothetical protein
LLLQDDLQRLLSQESSLKQQVATVQAIWKSARHH